MICGDSQVVYDWVLSGTEKEIETGDRPMNRTRERVVGSLWKLFRESTKICLNVTFRATKYWQVCIRSPICSLYTDHRELWIVRKSIGLTCRKFSPGTGRV